MEKIYPRIKCWFIHRGAVRTGRIICKPILLKGEMIVFVRRKSAEILVPVVDAHLTLEAANEALARTLLHT